MAEDYLLTTVDNPHDPHEDVERWDSWDRIHGYHTLALLARVINTSSDLSDADQDLAYDDAIRTIISENISGMHRAVNRAGEPLILSKV